MENKKIKFSSRKVVSDKTETISVFSQNQIVNEYNCPVCGKHHKKVLEGLQSFF